MTEQDVKAVAEGLSDAKRAFILALPRDGGWMETSREIDRHGRNALRGFGQSGLIEGHYKEEVRHRLTGRGLLVREHLEREHG